MSETKRQCSTEGCDRTARAQRDDRPLCLPCARAYSAGRASVRPDEPPGGHPARTYDGWEEH